MRVLIMGGDGMLGHRLLLHLRDRCHVRATLHRRIESYGDFGIFRATDCYDDVDTQNASRLRWVLHDFRPDFVVNCIGIVKQRDEARLSIPSIETNALFPHVLAREATAVGARIVQMSTDCVFSGQKGNYTEEDIADADDLYGRTKYLGELSLPGCVTLRTSIIGRELSRKRNLLEWFLSQRGQVAGYRKVLFSGFTTVELSRVVERLMVNWPPLPGVYHVSSQPIDKFSLLNLIKDRLNLDIRIQPDDRIVCDRSLDSSRFRQQFGYHPPTWEAMIGELGEDVAQPFYGGTVSR